MAVHKFDRQSTGVAVNTDDVKLFIRDLRKASKAAATEMRTLVKASAEIVAVEARQIASQHSQSIPPTIKARTYLSGRHGAFSSVTAGKNVPLAALYELGNKGKSPNATTFRHPVFERGASGQLQQTEGWVDQPRWAFLLPAAEHTAPAVEASVEALADMVAEIIAIRSA